jgi:hypothetical protein
MPSREELVAKAQKPEEESRRLHAGRKAASRDPTQRRAAFL